MADAQLVQSLLGGGDVVGHEANSSSLAGIDDFEKLERMYLENILKETGNNKLQAAKRLGIDRSTLFRKMKKLGMS